MPIPEPGRLARVLLRESLPPAVRRRLRRWRGLGTDAASARYCYSVWMRHRSRLIAAGVDPSWDTVAELGPGASLGVGMAALLTGAKEYLALDVTRHAADKDSQIVFDGLVELFAECARVPGGTEYPEIRPEIIDDGFPEDLAREQTRWLEPTRVAKLRERLVRGDIAYITPWDDPGAIRAGTVNLIISQAVMEHVRELEWTYRAMWQWLEPGGHASHQIDLRSHGTSAVWNGHWRYGTTRWRLGRGDDAINRRPLSHHLGAMREAGFELVVVDVERRDGGLRRHQLDDGWQHLTDDDLSAAGAYVIARRPHEVVNRLEVGSTGTRNVDAAERNR